MLKSSPSSNNGLLTVTLIFFVLLVFVSCVGNLVLLLLIVKQKLYKVNLLNFLQFLQYLNVYCYLQESINLCVAQVVVVHLAQVAAVLPLTLATRLLHNWVMGQMLCYTIPVITVNNVVVL